MNILFSGVQSFHAGVNKKHTLAVISRKFHFVRFFLRNAEIVVNGYRWCDRYRS